MPLMDMKYYLPEECRGTILETIVQDKLYELQGARMKWPITAIAMALERAPGIVSLKNALLKASPAIIAEIKKASPSAGLLREDFDPFLLADQYEAAGAAALSVLTEVKHFKGGLEVLAGLRWKTRLPLLRKDFILHPYQLYEARHAGADAILLIKSLLDAPLLRTLLAEATSLGLEALVEVHTEEELDKVLESGATLIGVNNRDLRSMQVSLDVSLNLAPKIPKHVLAVSESGIRTREDIVRLAQAGYRGFLVGEHLVRSASPRDALAQLLSHRSAAGRSA